MGQEFARVIAGLGGIGNRRVLDSLLSHLKTNGLIALAPCCILTTLPTG